MNYLSQFRKSLSVAKKNLRIYYVKGPVIIFGILLPFFFFLAFWLGRDMPPLVLGTGLVGMAIWFTSTSISPVITPWETRTKTLERLISAPIGHSWILLGDMMASATIGMVMTIAPLSIASIFLNLSIVHPLILGVSLILASFCFSAIGVLMAALPTDTPADVMMLSSLIKFPIIFISGIFIPIGELPAWGQIVAHISPLTYLTDLTRWTFGSDGGFWPSPIQNLLILAGFFIGFFALAVFFHEKTLPKRL
ncbi:ABC transporter [candidate division MSBL1 archaeon SCGC-AAA382A13]|uniref:ABC transporter n=1 Tax=candidate division MSBL1 archaeon SCGC-AAA382A13 TaxID=1698279 RepID=A0A133VG07_9EURY|nr:ABC transporter [candidate division MSBL1 archaeon SCGC-AAA382A13]